MPSSSIRRRNDWRLTVAEVERSDRQGLVSIQALHRKIWRVRAADGLAIHLLQAAAGSGGLLLRATIDGEECGILVALSAWDATDQVPYLYVHNVGVIPGLSRFGVATEMMTRASEVAIARGYAQLRCYFDPFDVGHAYFYLMKLGGNILAYSEDHWGQMNDRINENRISDRLYVGFPALDHSTSHARCLPAEVASSASRLLEKGPKAVVGWTNFAPRWGGVRIPQPSATVRPATREASQFRKAFQAALTANATFAGLITAADGTAYIFKFRAPS